MAEMYLIDIPIYRTPRKAFEREINNRYHARIQEIRAINRAEPSDDIKMNIQERITKEYGGPWRFNQIIGWLRIYALGTQLRGESWLTTAKRITRNPSHKQIAWNGNAFEFTTSMNDTSAQIRNELMEEVKSFASSLKSHRYLDLPQFEMLSLHINWKKIMRHSRLHP